MTQHRHWFPFCPFVLGQNVGNIPLGQETGPQNIPEKEDQIEGEDRETGTNSEEDSSDDIINKIPGAGEAGDTQEEGRAEEYDESEQETSLPASAVLSDISPTREETQSDHRSVN